MIRPERTIIALDSTDARRFARSLMAEGDKALFFEEAGSWGQILRLLRHGTGTLIVLGARPPDKVAVRHLGPRADAVVILQHATNRRRSFNELSLGYFRRNFRKLVYWSLFTLLCSLVPRGRRETPKHVYYFTLDYRNEWARALGEGSFDATMCPRPDPTRFGTIEDIPVSADAVAYQMIDEPFTQTLGISSAQERALFEAILAATGDEIIMVKPHPRSRPGKCDFSDRFVVSETIYSHAKTVIGYRSGLLEYPFASPARLTIMPTTEGKGFDFQRSTMEIANEHHDTYLDLVEQELAAQGR